MVTPDPNRVGGLAWTQRTKGRLTAGERRELLGPITAALGSYVAGRSAPRRDACREQPPSVIGHSYRTWMFGAGLAALDGLNPDRELFYVACLLHDYGIAEVVAGEDFTPRSAGRLQRCADEAGLRVGDLTRTDGSHCCAVAGCHCCCG